MNGQTSSDRKIIYVKKRVKALLHALRPGAFLGRRCGPRVLMNSIPKSGTNLIRNTLNSFPLLWSTGRRTLGGWHTIEDTTIEAILKLRKGQFAPAHLPAHPELIRLLTENNIKSLCMIRDPRDVMVSHYHYVASIDLTHVAHDYFASLPDDDTRLMTSILGAKDYHSSVREVLEKYAGWLSDDNTLIIRYEDLVGRNGGGDDAAQFRTVRSIADHLEITLSEEQIRNICSKAYSTNTPTFRSGTTGTWRRFFKPEHIKAFKETTGELLIRFGYEKNIDW